MLGNSSVAMQMAAPQEGLSSVEFVTAIGSSIYRPTASNERKINE
jgi:hypothetical protein